MSFEPGKPDDQRKGPSWTRIAIWVFVAAVAIWLIVSGISGIIAKGG